MTEVKLKHVQGKNFVDVRATVEQVRKALETSKQIVLVARQKQISRVAMIIKSIEQECDCKITKMNNVNTTEEFQDKESKDGSKRKFSVLYFRVTFTKN